MDSFTAFLMAGMLYAYKVYFTGFFMEFPYTWYYGVILL
jgi:hypothetical protein